MQPTFQRVESSTPERVLFSVRPSFLFVGVKYAFAAGLWLASAALVAWLSASMGFSGGTAAIIIVVMGGCLFAFPVAAHLKRQRWLFTLTTFKLEIREGILSTTTRNVPLSKIQDVTTTGSFFKRMLGLGDIVVETAAESGQVLMSNIPEAKRLTDVLLEQLSRWNSGDRSGV